MKGIIHEEPYPSLVPLLLSSPKAFLTPCMSTYIYASEKPFRGCMNFDTTNIASEVPLFKWKVYTSTLRITTSTLQIQIPKTYN